MMQNGEVILEKAANDVEFQNKLMKELLPV